jgi:hypothetical protein
MNFGKAGSLTSRKIIFFRSELPRNALWPSLEHELGVPNNVRNKILYGGYISTWITKKKATEGVL